MVRVGKGTVTEPGEYSLKEDNVENSLMFSTAWKEKPWSGACDAMAVCPASREPVLRLKTRLTLKI